MANNIFNPEIDYVKRFVDRHGKRIKMPNFTNLDAKLHPKYKNHIVVLGRNKFPSGTKMAYMFKNPVYNIEGLHYDENFKQYFEEALTEAELRQEEQKNEKEHIDIEK
jgi:predicted LPLAT superfamily acyltransferase